MAVFPQYQSQQNAAPTGLTDELPWLKNIWNTLTQSDSYAPPVSPTIGPLNSTDPGRQREFGPEWSVKDALNQISREHAQRALRDAAGETTIGPADPYKLARANSQTSFVDWLSPTLGSLMSGQKPLDLASLSQSLGEVATGGLDDLMKTPLMIGSALFRNKKIPDLLEKSLTNIVGKRPAKQWTDQARDLPVWMENKPALGMMEDLYDVLGIQGNPKMQSRFGAEVEGAGQLKPRLPADMWTVSTDPSVGPSGIHTVPFEAQTRPLQGMDDIRRFYSDLETLNTPLFGDPVAISGPQTRSGAHTNISLPDMNPQEVRRMVELFMKQEPWVYPLAVKGENQRERWAAPMYDFMGEMASNPAMFRRTFSDPSASLGQIGSAASSGVDSKYHSLWLGNLAGPKGTERLEFRFPTGTVDPKQWMKQFLMSEVLAQEARATAAKPTWFGDDPMEFMQTYADWLAEKAPGIQKARLGRYDPRETLWQKDPFIGERKTLDTAMKDSEEKLWKKGEEQRRSSSNFVREPTIEPELSGLSRPELLGNGIQRPANEPLPNYDQAFRYWQTINEGDFPLTRDQWGRLEVVPTEQTLYNTATSDPYHSGMRIDSRPDGTSMADRYRELLDYWRANSSDPFPVSLREYQIGSPGSRPTEEGLRRLINEGPPMRGGMTIGEINQAPGSIHRPPGMLEHSYVPEPRLDLSEARSRFSAATGADFPITPTNYYRTFHSQGGGGWTTEDLTSYISDWFDAHPGRR